VEKQPRKTNTRDKILSAALSLFNAQGSAAVSTNHVCEKLGISPGNLYYYFRSRENIVYGLAIQYAESLPRFWQLEKGQAVSLSFLLERLRFTYELNESYRFLLREAVVLSDSGLNLRKLMESPISVQKESFRKILAALSKAGYFKLNKESLEWLASQTELLLYTPDLPIFIAGKERWDFILSALLLFAGEKARDSLLKFRE